jgi:hypothetical protein
MSFVVEILDSMEIPQNEVDELPPREGEHADLPNVSIRGHIVGRSEDKLIMSIGDLLYHIPVSEILSVQKDVCESSQTATRGVAAYIEVRSAALLLEMRYIRAASTGLRAFAFAMTTPITDWAGYGQNLIPSQPSPQKTPW